jgi:hypothetical protein
LITNTQIQAFLNGLAKLSQETGVVIADGDDGVCLVDAQGEYGFFPAVQPVQYGCRHDRSELSYHKTREPDTADQYFDSLWAKYNLKSA